MARALSLPPPPGRRINVVGTTGSGKTTLAADLAGRLSCPHVELDALHWGPNWTPVPHQEFRRRIVEALEGDAWTVDGNYSRGRDIIMERIDTLVWLDYPLWLILGRLFRRTIRRVVTKEELWSGNRERGWQHMGRDSLFLWALRTYWRRKRQYTAVRNDPEYAYLIFVHLRSPRSARAWIGTIAAPQDWTERPAGSVA